MRIVEVETTEPSPFARSLLFGYVGAFLYEGDSPLAERRAAALSLDSTLLAELLGQAELRELLDPEALAQVERDLQRLSEDRQARDAEGTADLLRVLGPLSTRRGAGTRRPGRLAGRARRRPPRHPRSPGRRGAVGRHRGRRTPARRAGGPAAGRRPGGLPRAGHRPVRRPRGALRPYPRALSPPPTSRTATGSARPWSPVPSGGSPAAAAWPRASSGRAGRAPSGATPRCSGCCVDVRWPLLRQEAEPVPPAALARFLPAWQGVGGALPRGRRGAPRRRAAPGHAGAGLGPGAPRAPRAGRRLLPGAARRADHGGRGPLGGARRPARRRRLAVAPPRRVGAALAAPGRRRPHAHRPCTKPSSTPSRRATPCSSAPCRDKVGSLDDTALAAALWDLVWSGQLTNDTLGPLRAAHRLGPRRPPRAHVDAALPVRPAGPRAHARPIRTAHRLRTVVAAARP